MKVRKIVYSVLTFIVAVSPITVVGMLTWYIYMEETGTALWYSPFIFMLMLLAIIAADMVLENMKPPLEPSELPRFWNPSKELDDFLIGPQADELDPKGKKL